MNNNKFDGLLGSVAAPLMEDEIKRTHRAYSDAQFESCGIYRIDKRYTDSLDVISDCLNLQYSAVRREGDKPSEFYCGITNDPVARKETHEREDYAGQRIELMVAVLCKTASIAAAVERKMHDDYGFYIGNTQALGNGAADDSDYVYIYRIPK